jgi:hypothetical protein
MQSPEAVWETYVSTWKEPEMATKRALFERCLAPACVYTDPLTQARGWDALTSYMMSFHESAPGVYFATQKFTAHHGRSLAHWQMLSSTGEVLGDGSSYAEYDAEGRLLVMTGFFQVPEEQPAA